MPVLDLKRVSIYPALLSLVCTSHSQDFRHKHKQLRPSGTVGSDEGVSDGIDAGVAGGSNPTSPFRCKAGWVDENGKATKGGLDAPVSGAAAASSGAADENKKNVLP